MSAARRAPKKPSSKTAKATKSAAKKAPAKRKAAAKKAPAKKKAVAKKAPAKKKAVAKAKALTASAKATGRAAKPVTKSTKAQKRSSEPDLSLEVSVASTAEPKASESLLAHLTDVIQGVVDSLPDVERRKMFSSDGWFTIDSVFTLVSRQGRIVVRLPDPEAQDQLLALKGAALWQIRNKPPMRGWLVLPEWMHEDADALKTWLGRAHSLAPAAGGKKKVPASVRESSDTR